MAILVGTASWTDKSLIATKRFYPKGCNSAEDRLRFYATQFDMVEVDSSYYAMPSPANSRLWAERTPSSFTFNVKAWRLFTGHPRKPEAFPKDLQPHLPPIGKKNLYYRDVPHEIREELWRRFIEALIPLEEVGKLGAVLLQFAPWLISNREGRAHVEHCVEHLAGALPAVEFRNKSWFSGENRKSTLDWERDLGVAHVVVDAPNVATSNVIPAVWEVTNPALAIVRLHGRNHETWNVKGEVAASDRFDYDYSDAELAQLAQKMQDLATKAAVVHSISNNNNGDQAQRNARTLRRLLHQIE